MYDGIEIRFLEPLIVIEAGELLTDFVPVKEVGSLSPILIFAVPEVNLTLVILSYPFSKAKTALDDADCI